MIDAEFKAYVADFEIPAGSGGSCAIEATVDKNFIDYDFFVYYLVDCTDEEFEITFKK